MSFNNPIRRFFELSAAEIAKATVEYQKQKDALSSLNDEFDDIEESLRNVAAEAATFAKNSKESARQVSEIKSIYNSLSKSARNLSNLTDDYSNGILKTKDVSKTLRDIIRDEDRLTRQITQARKEGNKDLATTLIKEQSILDKEKAAAIELKKQNELIDNQVGLTGKLLSSLEKLPIIGEAIDFNEINTSMRSAAGHSNVFAAGLKTAGKQLKEGLKDPLIQFALMVALYKQIYDLAKEHDEMLTKSGRQLAINKEEANELYKNYSNYASSVHDSFVTGKRLLESNLELNEALGTTVAFSEKSADAFARLTHYYSLSAEQAAKLEELGQEQGKDASFILSTTIKTASEQKKQFGGTISYQNVLKKVSGVSGEILTKFKGNTTALVEAVMQADRLGLSLEQVDKVGESLLNFESSIESELKAELLTGKAINLEKARSAALSGDTAKLTEEIVKQVGSIHEFEKMNVLQRKAYAEVFGMGVNEMGDMLRKKEFEAQLGDKIKASAEEQLKYATEHGITMSDAIRQSLEQKSLAEEQKEIFDKLRDVIRKITSGPMLQFFHLIEKALGGVLKIVELFGSLTGGVLGSGLAAALIGLPAAIAVMRLGASLFMPKPTGRTNDPIATYSVGGIGAPGMPAGPTGLVSMTTARGITLTRAGAPAAVTAPGVAARGGMMNMRNLGAGMGLGIGGMALMNAAGGMEQGGAKNTVSVLGGAASGAGMGMMFGPWGAAIGGVIGGVASLVSVLKNSEEHKKAEEANAKEAQRKTQELIEAMSVRPISLNVNNNTIGEWNTASSQNGSNSSFA